MFPTESLYFTIPLFLISLLFIRRVLYGFFDPFLVSVFGLCSAIGLMLNYFFEGYFNETRLVIVFLLCHIAFLAGLSLATRTKPKIKHLALAIHPSFLKLNLYVALLLMLILLVMMAKTVGIGILLQNPETAKNIIFTGGGGIFKRTLPAISIIAFGLLLVVNFYQKFNFPLNIISVAILFPAAISTGAKGALLVFFSLLVFYNVYLHKNLGIKITLKRYFMLTFMGLLVMAGAIIVLALTVANTEGVLGTELIQRTLIRLDNRLIGFGDTSLYYFFLGVYDQIAKTPLDYIYSLANTVLGPLRLAEYIRPLGAEMYSIAFHRPNEGNFGPNAQLYFAGVIYFGPLFGIVYSFAIGYLVAWLRRAVLFSCKKTNIEMWLFLVINTLIIDLPTDITYTLSNIFSITIMMIFIFSISFMFFVLITGIPPFRFQNSKQKYLPSFDPSEQKDGLPTYHKIDPAPIFKSQ